MKRYWIALVTLAFMAGLAQAQEWAKEKLAKSTRHQEYVTVKAGNREVKSFIVYPEVKDKATAVIVIHEIFGLSDWVRLLTDELAAEGYIAIAPDLLSGSGPNGGGSDELKDKVGSVIRTLKPEQITADLNGCYEYLAKVPACNGKIAVCGFCWGGGQSFRYATNNKNLKAAFVFYGSTQLKDEDVKRISAPVYGFYAENDSRINASLDDTKKLMKASDKKFEDVIFSKGGHGFMRGGDDPKGREGDKSAHGEAWTRWKDLLKKL